MKLKRIARSFLVMTLSMMVLISACSEGGGGGGGGGGTPSLAAPTGVTVSVSGTTVTIHWNAVAGATSYNLYYGINPGITKASSKEVITGIPTYYAGQVLEDSYEIDPGTYYLALSAVNGGAESSLSSPEVTFVVGSGGQMPSFNGANVTTFSGSRSMGLQNGPANSARFLGPRGLAADSTYIYVADTQNNIIRAVSVADGHAYSLAGDPDGYTGSADGDNFSAGFKVPSGVAVGGGYVYVADTGNSTIRRISLSSPFTVTTIAGSAGVKGSADGIGTAATFNNPGGVAVSGNSLFVADTGNNTIRKIDLGTNTVTTLAGSANAYAGSTDGVGTAARFNFPFGITVDPSGMNVYVADSDNGSIRKIATATRTVTTVNNSLSSPAGIVTDGTYLLVTDATDHNIVQIELSTGNAQILAGGGDPAVESKDGIGTDATFNQPLGIAILGTKLFVSDTLSHIMRRIE